MSDLKRFFSPRSIALVGASDDLAKFGGRCLRQLSTFGFSGPIYPVNPKYKQIGELPCYPDIASLPETPDHVGVSVAAPHVLSVMQACAARDVPFVTLFSSGFAETGEKEGRELQNALAQFAHSAGIRFMGPNCNGLINFHDRVALTSSGALKGPPRKAGDIGIVSHSGGVGSVNVMWRLQQLGLGVSHQITCGNDADLTALDFAQFMIEDPATAVILLVLERLGDISRFVTLTEAAHRQRKPMIAIKLGRTASGQRLARQHTGADTGSTLTSEAALRYGGVLSGVDCPDLYHQAMLLRLKKLSRAEGVTSLSLSGGNLALLAELGEEEGLRWPDYAATSKNALSGFLNNIVLSNPLDLTAGTVNAVDTFNRALQIIAADPEIDVVLPIITFENAKPIRTMVNTVKALPKAAAIIWTGNCLDDPKLSASDLITEDVAVFTDPAPAVKAVRGLIDYSQYVEATGANTSHDPKAAIAADDAGEPADRLSAFKRAGLMARYAGPPRDGDHNFTITIVDKSESHLTAALQSTRLAAPLSFLLTIGTRPRGRRLSSELGAARKLAAFLPAGQLAILDDFIARLSLAFAGSATLATGCSSLHCRFLRSEETIVIVSAS